MIRKKNKKFLNPLDRYKKTDNYCFLLFTTNCVLLHIIMLIQQSYRTVTWKDEFMKGVWKNNHIL